MHSSKVKDFFSKAPHELLLDDCIWCKDEDGSSNLLLHSQPKPSESFLESTKEALYSCTECQDAYYRSRLKTSSLFLECFDNERLIEPLKNFLEGHTTHTCSKFVLTIYEILSNPYHLQSASQTIAAPFWKVIETLIERKKMIRSGIVLPGFFLFLHQSPTLQNWIMQRLPLDFGDCIMQRSSAIPLRRSLSFRQIFQKTNPSEHKRIILYLPFRLSHHHIQEMIPLLKGEGLIFSMLKNCKIVGDKAAVIECLFKYLKEWDPSILRLTLRSFTTSATLLQVFESNCLLKEQEQEEKGLRKEAETEEVCDFGKLFCSTSSMLEKGNDCYHNILLFYLLKNPSPSMLSLAKAELGSMFVLNTKIHPDLNRLCKQLSIIYRKTELGIVKQILERFAPLPSSSFPLKSSAPVHVLKLTEGQPPSKLQRLKMEYAEERRVGISGVSGAFGAMSSSSHLYNHLQKQTKPSSIAPSKALSLQQQQQQRKEQEIDRFGPVVRHSSTVLLGEEELGRTSIKEKRLKSITANETLQKQQPLSVQEEIDLLQCFHTKILENRLPTPLKDSKQTFETHQEYVQAMEPLIYEETMAQIKQATPITNMTTTVVIESLRYSDSLIDLITSKGDGENDASESFSEQEVVELEGNPGCRGIVMGLIRGKSVKVHLLRSSVPADLIRIGGKLSFIRMDSTIVTDWRQLLSLYNLRCSPFLANILRGKVFRSTVVFGAEERCKNSNLNVSQQMVLQTAKMMPPHSISLVQGPPGTGKTSTIDAVVSAILESSVATKILICCPSNTAVDEIVRRIAISHSGSVIRVGQPESMAEDVKAFSLDRLKASFANDKKADCTAAEKVMLSELKERLLKTKAMPPTVQVEQRRKELEVKIRNYQRSITSSSTISSIELLKKARVICSTLSGAGHETLSIGELNPQTLIVDEACQSVECLTLIPLRFPSLKRIILVGDPRQLPPTLLSSAPPPSAARSLFERLYQVDPSKSQMLNLQYRMHPEISAFPSKEFYFSLLGDSPSLQKDNARPYHQRNQNNAVVEPFLFCNIIAKTSKHRHSNAAEADCLLEFLKFFIKTSPKGDRIGIITPYREQQRLIKSKIASNLGSAILEHCQVMTVDGFQGQEREVILFSCVRSSGDSIGEGGGRGIGFLKDERRLNVALTRSKSTLVVIGDAGYLASSGSPCWKRFISNATQRGLVKDWETVMMGSINTSLQPSSIIKYIDDLSKSSLTTKKSDKAPKKIQSPLERRRN